ncbi:MAG: carboxylating nicotinate-nucleotide diphosphorylase [Gemmatimonadota bacterium]
MLHADADRVARMALAEDGARDITSEVCVAEDQQGVAVIEAREACVLAGRVYADAVTAACGVPTTDWSARDGERIAAGMVIGTLTGPLRALLRAERPLLNLLQRAAGIATMTHHFAAAVAGTGCRVLHTRKTTPGLRLFEVHAVLVGGGTLHRLDLAQAVMVKDNHWQALAQDGRTLAAALAAARELGTTDLQVEVESMAQLELACAAGATRLLIDNQTPATVKAWGRRARDLAPEIDIEATGGITLETVRAFAEAGADYVSTGSLTHSVRAVDLGLEIR